MRFEEPQQFVFEESDGTWDVCYGYAFACGCPVVTKYLSEAEAVEAASDPAVKARHEQMSRPFCLSCQHELFL